MSLIIYKSTANIQKLQPDSQNADREGYVTLYQGLRVNIQPAGLEYVATSPDGAIGKTYRGFTSYSGCQIGMVLVTSGTATISGMRYAVIGVEDFSGPLGRTFELLLRKVIK